MHTLHILHQYLPEHIGGTELYAQTLTDQLHQRGHQTTIFHRHSALGRGLRTRQPHPQLTIHATWDGFFSPTRRFLATFRSPHIHQTFIKILDQTPPDLVHIHHLMGLPYNLATELQHRQIPYIITLHDFWWVCANAQLITNDTQEICAGPDRFHNCARCALARANRTLPAPLIPLAAQPLAQRNARLQTILHGAQNLIAPAHFVKQWYQQHGLPSDSITVIPHGLDISGVQPANDTEPRPLRLGYIGGISWQKGVHTLIDAVNQLPHPPELWIAGDLNAFPDYAQQLQTSAHKNTRFLGRLTRDQIWHMLAQIDLIVVPSVWYETFCFVISEAFAAGVPVIASDIGVLAERVHHGIDGFLFPPGDSTALSQQINQIQQNPAQLAHLQASITPVTTLEQHATAIENLYQQLLTTS
ncbi:MAG TPA: glycosyltransferase family 4 protein [Anaerolineae bacterium]|nr:glycosyltransferase family 4 protein [Anaerolineae bacterium]